MTVEENLAVGKLIGGPDERGLRNLKFALGPDCLVQAKKVRTTRTASTRGREPAVRLVDACSFKGRGNNAEAR